MRDITHAKHSKKYLTPQEVADLIGVRIQTLASWRCRGVKGLPYIDVGRILYDQDDIFTWLDSRKVNH